MDFPLPRRDGIDILFKLVCGIVTRIFTFVSEGSDHVNCFVLTSATHQHVNKNSKQNRLEQFATFIQIRHRRHDKQNHNSKGRYQRRARRLTAVRGTPLIGFLATGC